MKNQEFVSPLENPLLTPLFDQVRQIVDYAHVSIYLQDGSDLRLLAYRGPIPPGWAALFSFPLKKAGGARWVIEHQTRLLIADARGDSTIARSFLEATQDVPQTTFDYIGSWMGFPLFAGGQVIGMFDLAHETRNYYTEEHTERVEQYLQGVAISIENAVLYANLNQQSAETRTLYALQQAIHSQMDATTVLQLVADEAVKLTSAQQALVLLLQQEALRAHVTTTAENGKVDVDQALLVLQDVAEEALESKEPVRLFDTQTPASSISSVMERMGVRSLVAVPLLSKQRPLGALLAINKQFGAFGPSDERLLTMLASGAAIALENTRLYHQEQKRRRAAEGKQAILASLSSTQPLGQILQTSIEQACRLLDSQAGSIYLLGPGGERVNVAALFRLPFRYLDANLALTAAPPMAVWSQGNAYINCLAGQKTDLPPALAHCLGNGSVNPAREPLSSQLRTYLFDHYQSALTVPLTFDKQPIGLIELYGHGPCFLEPERLELAEDISQHVALALERARLSEKAEELARLQERQRIAQALHDSVAQNLFRAGLEATWCLDHLKPDEETAQRLRTVKRLVARSSYELRSAIFALRNRKLTRGHSLVELLQDQVDEFNEQTLIPTTLVAPPHLPHLPVPVAEAIFRIVREALSNVSKHASASAVVVSLRCDGELLSIIIQDNGVGLQTVSSNAQDTEEGLHFGLDTIRRLVAQLEGTVFIGGNDDRGTTVKATFPLVCLEATQ